MRSLAICCILTILFCPSLDAQGVHRSGAWFNIGFGVGQFRLTCDECPEGGTAGASQFVVRGGWAFTPAFLVGVELDTGNRQDSGDAIKNISLASYFYPFRKSGLFVKAGVGHASFDSNTPNGPNDEGSGLGLMAGLGYDLRATSTISLTPTATVIYGNIGQVGSPQFFGRSGVNVVVAAVSIGVTFH